MVCYMRHACALIQQLLYNNIEGLLKVIAMENCRTWVVNKVSISNPNPVIYIYSELRRVNCSFYFKIGACRHGDRCSRLHNKPTFSQVSWEYSFSRSSELGRLTVLPITGVIFIVYIVSAPSFPKPSALCFIPDDFVAKYVPESSKCSTSGRWNK